MVIVLVTFGRTAFANDSRKHPNNAAVDHNPRRNTLPALVGSKIC